MAWKIEKNSSGWVKARSLYSSSDISISILAERIGVDEKTIRNRVKDEGWTRNSPDFTPERDADAVLAPLAEGNIPLPADIARNACVVVDALRVHLQTVVMNLNLVQELADAAAGGDKGQARSRLVDKILSLPGLMKAANDLTAAIAKLADNAPGKRETAQEVAKDTAKGRFATPAAPKIDKNDQHRDLH